MLNELSNFYSTSASILYEFFSKNVQDFKAGMRFSLKLDSEDLVAGIHNALENIVTYEGVIGDFNYEQVYKTFTIKLSNGLEVIVASKINMTNDFLATLRNTDLLHKKQILLILTNTYIETLYSGTGDLTAKGMPFNQEILFDTISNKINDSQNLQMLDKMILSSELSRRKNDKYGDKSSISGFADVVNIMKKGYVEDDDYSSLSLLKDQSLSLITQEKDLKKRIDENHKLFSKIDEVFKRGNIEEDLNGEFDSSLIEHLTKCRRKDIEWSDSLNFDKVQKSKDKKNKELDNPFKIYDENIEVYTVDFSKINDLKVIDSLKSNNEFHENGDNLPNSIESTDSPNNNYKVNNYKANNDIYNEDVKFDYSQIPVEASHYYKRNSEFFIKDNDGAIKKDNYKKNILIYNTLNNSNVFIAFKTNVSLKDDSIEGIDSEDFSIFNRTIYAKINTDYESNRGIVFRKINITDEKNNISYEYKICILNIESKILKGIETDFSIAISKNLKKSFIRLNLAGNNLVINGNNGTNYSSDFNNDNNIQEDNNDIDYNFDYNLNYSNVTNFNNSKNIDETSNSYINKTIRNVRVYDKESYDFDNSTILDLEFIEDNFPDSGKLHLYLDYLTSDNKSIIIPIEVLGEKKKSSTISGHEIFLKKHIAHESFILKDNNLINLGVDNYLIDHNLKQLFLIEKTFITQGFHRIKKVGDELIGEILDIPRNIAEIYKNLVDEIRRLKSLPSLVFYKYDLLDYAYDFVYAILDLFKNIETGKQLPSYINNIILLGTYVEVDNDEIIKFSPLSPLNIMYQLSILKEKEVGYIRIEFVKKLTALYLLPFIKIPKKGYYYGIEQNYSSEWLYYAPISNKRYLGSRNFVKDLVVDKINQYIEHFSFLFTGINNRDFNINLINLGDCKEIFHGLVNYFSNIIRYEKERTFLLNFNVFIYNDSNFKSYNEFFLLSDSNKIEEYIVNNKIGNYKNLSFVKELTSCLTENLHYYIRKQSDKDYGYAHIAFYEMIPSNNNHELSTIRMSNITTGVSLGGLISSVPSVLNESRYSTGFGTKYIENNNLISMAKYYNELFRINNTSSTYEKDLASFSEIDQTQDGILLKLYSRSNWVVFIDPKVELSFFHNKNSSIDKIKIIHYSDNYSSSQGFDDITVTQKSMQYFNIIKEYLYTKQILVGNDDINKLINLFNAINGSWLLRLIGSSKNNQNMFSKEKISILSAVKLCLSFFYHDDILWVPISLEELLRVSGGAKLSSKEGIMSAKNLGFEKGPTCDDILFVGIMGPASDLEIILHPVEVKIGQNQSSVINKAKAQIKNTYTGFHNILYNEDTIDLLEVKLTRNYFIQLIISAVEKMDVYDINDNNWNLILEDYRENLINGRFQIKKDIEDIIGVGTVVAFTEDENNFKYAKDKNFNVNIIELPISLGDELLVEQNSKIEAELSKYTEFTLMRFKTILASNVFNGNDSININDEYLDFYDNLDIDNINNRSNSNNKSVSSKDLLSLKDSKYNESNNFEEHIKPTRKKRKNKSNNQELDFSNIELNDDIISETEDLLGLNETSDINYYDDEDYNDEDYNNEDYNGENYNDDYEEISSYNNSNYNTNQKNEGIKVLFGLNKLNKAPCFWEINNTNLVTNFNTGIIGASGTGKTQFTKSLVTQLYNQRENNLNGSPFSILIFDYKGDYNHNHTDFLKATNALVVKLSNIPFNPFAIYRTNDEALNTKLPYKVGKTFVETLSQSYRLGYVQATNLNKSIKQAYINKGIDVDNEATWSINPPTFDDVYNAYMEDDSIKKNDSLYSVMEDIKELNIFDNSSNSKSLFEILRENSVVVVDVSTSNSRQLQNLIVGITLDLFYAQMRAQGSSKTNNNLREITNLLLVDEADNFMSTNLPVLKNILKEGREFGVGTILSTQSLKHFNKEDDYSIYINTWIVHNVAECSMKDIDFIFKTGFKTTGTESMFNKIKQLKKHESVVKIGTNAAITIHDLPFFKLIENNGNKDS